MTNFLDGLDDEAVDWDPEEKERVYYRLGGPQGSLGYKVKRNGREMIHLDRPDKGNRLEDDLHLVAFTDDWKIERDYRPMTRFHGVQVAFHADRRLCQALGMHEKARKEWASLKDAQKVRWIEHGPSDPPIRARMYAAIMDVLEPIIG